MGELNKVWALEVLRDYVWAATKVPSGELTPAGNPKMGFPVDRDEIDKRLHVAQQVVRRVLPGEEWNGWWGYQTQIRG